MAINGLGDIVALVQITTSVATTLRAATHAPDEIRRFIAEIDRYQSCVAQAAGRIRRHGAVLKSYPDVKRNVFGVLEQCEASTKKLRRIAIKYQDVIDKKGLASDREESWNQWIEAFKTVYQSIKWTTKADFVEKFRQELFRNMQMLKWLEDGLVSDRIDQLSMQVDRIHQSIISSMSSPSRTPLSSPFDLSPNPLPQNASQAGGGTGTGSQLGSPQVASSQNAQPQLTDLHLPPPTFDLDSSWHFRHDIDSELKLPDSFPGATPGDEFRHVKLASKKEQDDFLQTLRANADLEEFRIKSVKFVFRKTSTSDEAVILASDAGKVLLIKNGTAVEDIWTINEKKTIRFRQRLPTWDEIVPYSINGDEMSAVVEQGEGLVFFTIEDGRRKDHPQIPTTWVTYTFYDADDCQRFQTCLYGWKLHLIVPVNEICIPHKSRSDESIVGFETLRVWERGGEMRFMAHLIQEKGKRRKSYLEFDLRQDGLKVEARGTGSKSTIVISGVNALIDEVDLERRGSTSSIKSSSTATSAKSLTRRFSWERTTLPFIDKVEIHFEEQEHRDDLLELAPICRPTQRTATSKSLGKKKIG